MRITLKIATTEVKQFVCSPIAWLVLAIFAIQTGMSFADAFDSVLSRQMMNYVNFDISRVLFMGTNPSGSFVSAQQYLFLYLPLLSMGVMAHEYASGSIRLLHSSPVSSRQIIVGKYLALLAVGLGFPLILGVQGVFAAFTVEHFDVPYFLTAMLAVYLLAATYLAIGLFVSVVVRSAVASALVTLALLALLNFVGTLWQDVPVVNQITYWLCIKDRANQMLVGLISSEDVAYFVIVATMFVTLSVMVFSGTRLARSRKLKAASFALVVLVAVALGFATTQPMAKHYCDTTFMKSNSLLPQHQDILRNLKQPLTITSYVNLLDSYGSRLTPRTVLNDMKTYLENYIRFKPDIKTRYVFYYADPRIADKDALRDAARKMAVMNEVDLNDYTPAEKLDCDTLLAAEGYRFFRTLTCADGCTAIVRTYDDIEGVPRESEYMAAFMQLAMPLPKVAFVTGHGERSATGQRNRDISYMATAKRHRKALVNQGFAVEEVSLTADNAQADIYVLGDCGQPYSADELSRAVGLVDSGKNIILLADSENNLLPLLSRLDLELGSVTKPHPLDSLYSGIAVAHYAPESSRLDSSFYWARQSGNQVVMTHPRSIKHNGNRFAATPILVGDDSTDSTLAVALERKAGGKLQRIFVSSDADWVSNGELKGMRPDVNSNNHSLMMNLMSWLTYGQLPIAEGRQIGPDTTLTIKDNSCMPYVKGAFTALLPAIFVVVGAVVILRRKNK